MIGRCSGTGWTSVAASGTSVSLLEPDWVFQHRLHPEAVLGVVRDGADPVDLAPVDVQENGTFLSMLSRVIFETSPIAGTCGGKPRSRAAATCTCWMPRTTDPAGRVPAEDIIGAVQVVGGAAVAGSFQHSPKHRRFTAAG
jgi:hypothetical protein